LDKTACKEAWKQLTAGRTIEPAHELATVRGRGHFLICGIQQDPGWLWHEIGKRSYLWLSAGKSPVYLDSEGLEWIAMPSLVLSTPQGPTFSRGTPSFVALPVGQSFVATPCPQSLGLLVLPHAENRSVVGGAPLSRRDLDDDAYVAAVVSLLSDIRLR
jgi:hypothetical protein